ncbi:MAG: type I restriction endonuclease subunit R, partial [bacterium]
VDPELEKLYSFGRSLLPHLPTGRDPSIIRPEDDVSLQYYRQREGWSGAIELDNGEDVEVKSPTEVGTGKAHDEKALLSDIIEILNDRFGTEFTEEDRLFFEQIKEKACRDEGVVQTADANPLDKFQRGIRSVIERFMVQRMSENDEIVTRYMDDQEFQDTAFSVLTRDIYDSIRQRVKNDETT